LDSSAQTLGSSVQTIQLDIQQTSLDTVAESEDGPHFTIKTQGTTMAIADYFKGPKHKAEVTRLQANLETQCIDCARMYPPGFED